MADSVDRVLPGSTAEVQFTAAFIPSITGLARRRPARPGF
jgi:hypothetical protein